MDYLFGHAADADTLESRRIAAMLQGQVAHFVRTGDPNGKGLPVWPSYRGARPSVLLIEDSARAVPGFRAKQLDYWHQRWRARQAPSQASSSALRTLRASRSKL
jgi:carboxylesterase type B